MQQLPLGVQLEVSSRFETFRAGRNLAPIEELCALRRLPGQPPLWLCGGEGTGKSHLLQAACVRLSERGRATAYVPLRHYAGLAPELVSGYETLEAVLLDDVDAVAGDPGWEGALFTLHNELQEQGGRLVASARRPPAAIQWRLPDLGSRLAAASVHTLVPLPEAEQAEALLARATARGLEFPPDTLAYVLRHAPRDFGSLCRLLDEMDSASLATQRRLTIPLARAVLERC